MEESAYGIHRRTRPPGLFAAGLVAVGLLMAACSSGSASPGVAKAGSTATTAAASANKSSKASPLAYSQCMRAHGIGDFPDPNSQGQISLSAGPGSDLIPDNPLFQSAQQACKALQPTPTPAEQNQMHAAALNYAKCMRTKGIKDFPDPQTSSGPASAQSSANGSSSAMAINGVPVKPGGDLDPNNPLFQGADQACRHYLGNLPGGGAVTNVSGP